ncbi:macrophage mannose receptor 1-like [Genypterus blacodes]|uniref:macrophage mannose receptor 1-like n=1 Tax=Genypterus blacodes TaxID=154954 RepID=UPI003F76156B
MKRTQIWCLLLFISGFSPFIFGSSDFNIVNVLKTYTEAKSFCRENYNDLATVRNMADMKDLTTLTPSDIARAWIGLEIGDTKKWHWSLPGQKLIFKKWKEGEPQNENEDSCAVMNPSGEWAERDCKTKQSFVCHGQRGTTGPIYMGDKKSWRDAQNHCRDDMKLSDLVNIQSLKENEAVHKMAESNTVWIGLFSDPWKWSDGSNSSFRFWKPNRPNNFEDQGCVAAVFKDGGQWNNLKCTTKRRFICQGARKSTPTPATTNQTNLTTAPNTTTLATTSSQMTTASAPTQQTTVNVTYEEPSNTTTDVSNATTPPITCDAATYNRLPPENSPEKVVLIQKNVSWMEALSYCRMHHADLVYITTKALQDMVAEKAKNATSCHVWLGLRYACKSDFWFWTKLSPGCYQNWAPGHGPEGLYGCGATGAIQTTGGQQWVGLAETAKLNFLCYAVY